MQRDLRDLSAVFAVVAIVLVCHVSDASATSSPWTQTSSPWTQTSSPWTQTSSLIRVHSGGETVLLPPPGPVTIPLGIDLTHLDGMAPPTRALHLHLVVDEEAVGVLGGDVGAVLDHVGKLVAIGGAVYGAQVGLSMTIDTVDLWVDGDPFDEVDPFCALYEFGTGREPSGASAVVLLSGKTGIGQVAWMASTCMQEFGSFPIVTSGCVEVPGVVDGADVGGPYGVAEIGGDLEADAYRVLSTLGQIMNSPLSHCYGGLGGHSDPIDQCGVQVGNPSCHQGPIEQSPGTLMSLCELRTLSLGTAPGDEGVAPWRIAERIADHLDDVAGVHAGCLDLPSEIFVDGFESGDLSAW